MGGAKRRAFWTSRALVLCACILLVYSFVVTSNSPATVYPKKPRDDVKKPAPRLVFMVIDAFRLSFLTGPGSPMNFTRSSIESSSAVVYDAYARMPTVTLPRITAYITGTLPSFGTIVTNLATNEIKTDNWVSRLNANDRKVHFFGDDTWIKLLPGQFSKANGVTSFFVNDYTEVDNNVTRYLIEELSAVNWDALILHYLGLDHVGHSLGGTSPKIRDKLLEMDNIIEKIHRELSKTTAETYIIVCGDHGMNAAGSHGGASTEETRVPVVIWNINGNLKNLTNNSSLEKLKRIEQIDISATIFDLFGMEMPPDSYGIPLAELRRDDSLKTLKNQYNHFKKLIRDKKLSISDVCEENNCDLSSQFMKSTLEKWFKEVQEELIGSASEVPNFSLAVCVFILILASVLSSIIWIQNTERTNFFLFAVNVVCFASSLIEEEHEVWYFLASSAIVIRIGLNIRKWKQGEKNEVFSAVTIAILHRIAFGFVQSTRRRWSMDQNLLPTAFFPESFDFKVDDLHTFLNNQCLASIILSAILWQYFSSRSSLIVIFPFVSHLIRFYGYTQINAYFLAVFRVSVLPVSYFSGSLSSGLLSILLVLVPSSQQLLVFITYQIGYLSSKLNISHSESVILYMSSFFYTGNSNSLSTLSLTAGYVGLLDYYPVLVGFQLFLYTFAGPIAMVCGQLSSDAITSSSCSFYFTFRISCLATSIVCLYIFQHHLFVWSVYTPKVVYDLAHVIFCSFVDLEF